jgi:hypothetical protein
MAADSWERSTVCVRDAARIEGVLVVLVVVIEPVAVSWEIRVRNVEPRVGILLIRD